MGAMPLQLAIILVQTNTYSCEYTYVCCAWAVLQVFRIGMRCVRIKRGGLCAVAVDEVAQCSERIRLLPTGYTTVARKIAFFVIFKVVSKDRDISQDIIVFVMCL